MKRTYDWRDIEELAAIVCGLDYMDCDSNEVEQALYDKFECSFEQFEKIVDALVPFTPIVTTALLGAKVQGFVCQDSMIVKQEVQP